MVRVDASGITTKMVERKPFRNRPNQLLIQKTVCHDSRTVDVESAIPLTPSPRHSATPKPTAVSDNDVAKEALENGRFRETVELPSSPKPKVMGVAQVAPVVRAGAIWNATLILHRKVTPFGVMQREVYRLAAASILP